MKLTRTLALLVLALPASALATNGYFSHGYGVKTKGMGGAGIAYSQDSMAPATNPAGIVELENRFDVDVDYFSPKRSVTVETGSMATMVAPGEHRSGSTSFVMPEMGYSRKINDSMSAGFALYGNGGMNTDWDKAFFESPMAPATASNSYSNLRQMFLAPTFAMKVAEGHTLGLAVNLIYADFEARGLEDFGLTNVGVDRSYGYGARVGYQGKILPILTVGLTYQSKGKLGKFEKYKGLFAEEGSFDIPETYGAGLALEPLTGLVIAFDYTRINYEGIKALKNPMASTGALGSESGPGFGWKNMNIFKLGVSHKCTDAWTFRAGYNHGKMPLQDTETQFNILATATVEDHVTAGATWAYSETKEASFSYMHAFKKTLTGTNKIDLTMSQNALGIGWGWKI